MFGEVGEEHGQGIGIGLFWVLDIASQLLKFSQCTADRWPSGRALTYTYPVQDNLEELIIHRQLLQEFKVTATGQVDEDRDGIFGDRLKHNIQDQYRRLFPEAHGLRQ